MYRVLVVEDDPQIRERFSQSFAAAKDIQVTAWVSTVGQALQELSRAEPDVMLVDLGLPDGSGISVIREAHKRYPRCDIMVVTVFADQRNVLTSIEAGATGYLLKDDSQDDLVARIEELRNGGSPITPIIARQLLMRLQPLPAQADTEHSLSPRETEVLNLLARGFTYQEIAQLLGVSPHTISTHIKRLYEKMQVRSRSEAVFEAQRIGLLEQNRP